METVKDVKDMDETIFYTMADINTSLGLDPEESQEIFKDIQDFTDLSIVEIVNHLNSGMDTKSQLKSLAKTWNNSDDENHGLHKATEFRTGELYLPRVNEELSKEMTTATTNYSDSAGDLVGSAENNNNNNIAIINNSVNNDPGSVPNSPRVLDSPPLTPHHSPVHVQAKKSGALKKVRKFFGKISSKKKVKEIDDQSSVNGSEAAKRHRVKAFVDFLGVLVTRAPSSVDGGQDRSPEYTSTCGFSTSTTGCKFQMSDMSNSLCQIDVVNEISPPIEQRKILGQGSQGRVYFGNWQGEQVAIKEFTGGLLSNLDDGAMEELQRELSIMQQLNHRNIVKCHGVCLANPHRSLVLEYMDTSLHHILHKHKQSLSYKLVLKMASQICKALAYMHPNIIHRDIKPSNVLYKKGIVKLADFGITAIQDQSHISTTQNRGTIQYAAPELYTEGRINYKADIYSFGILLWEMYTRQRPWGKEQDCRIIFRVGSKSERPVIPDDCPQNNRQIVEKCWQQNPVDRPDAEEVLSLLKEEIMNVNKAENAS